MQHNSRFQFAVASAACAILLAATGNVRAGTISFNGEQGAFSGTGIGSVFTLITLQQKGSATTEAGSVSWNGTSDVITGNAKTGSNQTQTQLVSLLTPAAINQTNLDLVLQVNQNAGGANALDVNHPFTLNVFNSAGTVIDSATFTPGSLNADTSALTGTGTGSSGWIFRVTGLLASDFTTGTNRIGLDVQTMNNASSGSETFFLANADADPPVLTPEPSTIVMSSILLAMFGVVGLRKRMKNTTAAA